MSVSRKENGSLVKKSGRAIVDLVLSLTSNNAIANKVVTQNLNQKVTKFSGTVSGNTYVTVDQLAYDETNKKLGLKVNGADTVIPFSGGSLPVFACGIRYEYQAPASTYYDIYQYQVQSAETYSYCQHVLYNSSGDKINNSYIRVYQNNVSSGHSFTITFKKKTWARINNTVGWHYSGESITANNMFSYGFDALVFDE